MSVYLLDHPGAPSTIADELEAFLHVLIYGAVRRVHSNLLRINGMMTSYFSGCDFDGVLDTVSCPPAKQTSVAVRAALHSSKSAVIFSDPAGTIEQDHALNQLIKELLQIFHARYVVLEYEKQSAASNPRTPARPKPTALETIDERTNVADDEDVPVFHRGVQDAPVARPPQQVFDDAKLLSEHMAVLGIFKGYITSSEKRWPPADVVPDRLYEVTARSKTSQPTTTAASRSGDASRAAATNASAESADAPHESDNPAQAADEPVARATKRRRKVPTVQAEAALHPNEPPVAGPCTERLTRTQSRSRTAANAPATSSHTPLATNGTAQAQAGPAARVTRSMSGVLPNRGRDTQASETSLGRTRSTTRQSTAVARTESGGARGRSRASSQAVPSTEGGRGGGRSSAPRKGTGVTGRSRRA
ncbi:hypothetical protein C8T65DRAFT_651023 [Cerioporus squamosus]|nr:hypothetical protein C8T65DRAFT_651023 [Cerioporus squamosus]